MTLEQRIKMLMEGQKEGEAKDARGNPLGSKYDDAGNLITADGADDESDEDEDEEGDDKKTDLSKDGGATDDKNVSKVNEDATNASLEVGKNKKDPAPAKLEQPPSTGGQKADQSKLEVGKSRKDGTGPKGESAPQNDANARNFVKEQKPKTVPEKITVGEHMEAMFAGQELSEEFMQNASVIFEAAVSQIVEQRLDEEIETLQEEFQSKLEEAVDSVQNDLVESVDQFMTKAVAQWVEENRIAVESGIKVEMVTNFMDGLKTLFKESYIEVPEDRLDVVQEQANKIAELETAIATINEAHDQSVAEVAAMKRGSILEHAAIGMTSVQKDKFVGLCEAIAFNSEEDFEQKIKVLKEAYITPASKTVQEVEKKDAAPLTEEVSVNRYVNALKNPLKF